ncbi:MAG: hypothetical protein QOI24_2487 [Acidobacteriota bacterium]|jgi:hypothetical protein|nr:hypothetical protein [Acidobacteriota bacterium]
MTLIRAISAALLAIAALMTAYPANAGELIHVPLRNSRIDVEATYVQIAHSQCG